MDELDIKVILGLADNRMRISETARVLYVHRNTVIYHIDRIKRLTGLDPLNFYDLYALVQMTNYWRSE